VANLAISMPTDRSAVSGTSGLMPVATALARLLDGLAPTTSSTIPLVEAAGRCLATDLQAVVSLPADDLSAMDGYAVRRSECAPGTPLVRIGESAAGHPFSGTVQSGQAVRIFTGAIVPDGADAILLQEDADASGEEDGATVIPARHSGRQAVHPAGRHGCHRRGYYSESWHSPVSPRHRPCHFGWPC
jgi:molybdopterin molybdotransferase